MESWGLRSGPSRDLVVPSLGITSSESPPAGHTVSGGLRISKQLIVSVWAAWPAPETKPMFSHPRIPTGTCLDMEVTRILRPYADSGFSLWTCTKSKAFPPVFSSSTEWGQ